MSSEQFTSSGLSEATNTSNSWPVYVQLTNGLVYGADVVVNATGVTPSCNITFTGSHKVRQLPLVVHTAYQTRVLSHPGVLLWVGKGIHTQCTISLKLQLNSRYFVMLQICFTTFIINNLIG